MFAKLSGAMALAALTLVAAPAIASPAISVSVTGGTLGIGPEIGIRERHVGARLDATFLSVSHKFHTDALDYQGTARLRSAGSMFDYYPFGGGFRLSAGGRYNRNRLKVMATPTQTTTIGGQSFTPQQIGTLLGFGSVRKVSPALTLGFGGKPKRGFTFGIDAGVLFQGRVRVSDFVSSTGMIPGARLAVERDDFQADIGHYRVFPIAQASIGWRF